MLSAVTFAGVSIGWCVGPTLRKKGRAYPSFGLSSQVGNVVCPVFSMLDAVDDKRGWRGFCVFVGVRILKLRQWGVPCERQRLLSAPPCCVPHLYCSWPFSCANEPSQSFSLKPRRRSPRVHKSRGCWLSSSLGFLRSCFVSAPWSNFTTALF